MRPIDFSTEALVFIHVPKTAGSSVVRQLHAFFGPEACLTLGHGKVDAYRFSRLDELSRDVFLEARRIRLRLAGGHPLLRPSQSARDLSGTKFIHGHVALGAEPDVGKKPRYFSLLRRPFERFVSSFTFHHKRLEGGRRGRHPAHRPDGAPPESVEEFFDRLNATSARRWRNGQSRYFAPSGRAEDAVAAIERVDALVAPMHRIDDAFVALSRLVGGEIAPARHNVSEKPAAPVYRDGFKEEVEAAFAEDLALYDWATERFAAQRATDREEA